jgi:hypothetical protein
LTRWAYTPAVLMAAVLAASPAQGYGAGSDDAPDEPSLVIAAGDFNGDGIADLVEAAPSEGGDEGPRSLTVLLGEANGAFTPVPSRNLIGQDPRALVVGDFNGDGNPDVIVGDSDGALLEFLGDGKGNLVPAGKVATVGSIVSIAVGHFTHGRELDLAVSDVESNTAAIFLNSGNGSFQQTWSFQLPQQGVEFHIATADFDKDGIADLVVTSEDNADYEVMLGNGNGTFSYSAKLSHVKDPNSYCPA